MSEASERKQRRVERTRNAIMDASIDIIAEKGFKNATTKEIAARADMAEGTLYNYFKNKNDILIGITERYVSYRRNLNLPDNLTSMEDFMKHLYRSNAQNARNEHRKEWQVLHILLPEILTDKVLGKKYYEEIVVPFLNQVEKGIEDMQQRGHCIEVDPKILSRMLYSLTAGYSILDINGDPYVKNATDDFRRDTGMAYIQIFGKGLNLENEE